MNTYKLIIDGIFRTTIKGVDADDVYNVAGRIYGYDSDIKVIQLGR